MVMHMVILNLFLITFIVVFIVDVSGAVDSLKSGIKWVLTNGKMKNSNYDLKPLSCSLCMTFWIGLIYLLCTSNFTISYIACVCLLSASTGLLKDFWFLCEDIIKTIINIFYKLIDKL